MRSIAWAALSVLLVARGAAGAPVTISLPGGKVEASAERTGEAVTCRLLPLLDALGARPSYLVGEGRLSAVAPDGTQLQITAGEPQMVVNGQPRLVTLPFRAADGDLVGPAIPVARTLGCAAHYDAPSNELRIAYRLTQIEVFAAEQAALVHIRLSGPSDAELHRLTGPSRAYVDFPQLTWDGASETLETGGAGGLKRVRWALLQAWPPTARVVLDLEEGADAQLAQVADRMYVLSVRPKTEPVSLQPASLRGIHVFLDPAMGGEDLGARGADTVEKAVTLDVAIRLAVRLMNAGALVTLTRDSDKTVSPRERTALAKAVDANLAVTISAPAGKTADECGIQVAYSRPESAPLAQALRAALTQKLGARDGGAPQAPDADLAGLSYPSVVCGIGYLTCPEEGPRLASPSYREKVAAALADGIASHVAGARATSKSENQRKPGS
jgi:N-acetylmuramoyl-L-alanine amidase